jgi:hypothetical protein
VDDSTRDALIWSCSVFSAIQAIGVVFSFFGLDWSRITKRRVTMLKPAYIPSILVTGCFSSSAVALTLLLYRSHLFWLISLLLMIVVVVVVAWRNLPSVYESKIGAIDAEVYRIAIGPKAEAMVAKLTRDLYVIGEKVENFGLDVDILAEIYIVNQANHKQFVREIEASVEIDGKRLALVRQSNFLAYEFGGQQYEYCLNKSLKDNQFDRSELETLQPIFTSSLIALEARQPAEGWVHFLIKNVDPEKLNGNRTYKFSITDSVGREHPILKANMAKREGEVSVRAFRR